MKKLVLIALVIAGIGAFAVGVRGGWVFMHHYVELKEQREASRGANPDNLRRDRAPIVLSIYTVQHAKDSEARSDIVAAATRLVIEMLAS